MRYLNKIMLIVGIFILNFSELNASDFVTISFKNGASISIPNNWRVLSHNEIISLNKYISIQGNELQFTAILYDTQNHPIAFLSFFRVVSAFNQSDLIKMTKKDLEIFGKGKKNEAEGIGKKKGCHLTDWENPKKYKINNLYVLMHDYHFLCRNEPKQIQRGIYAWQANESFNIIITYYATYEKWLLPIVEKITSSMHFKR